MGAAVPFGKYVLLGRVSVGGMAEVFLAKTFGAEGFERFVALKRLLPSVMGNKGFVDMFIDEAKIAVQLTHANIAQIYELGKHGEQLYIAMEFVHGKELRALAVRAKKQHRPIDQRLVAFMVARAAEGLDYAHQKKDPEGRPLGIIHRDISPQNILVSFDGEVKIIDFGIAKAKDRISQTEVGVLKGKIGYMSPEQVMGLPIDQRSDLFSLGCVLYELVTGERAFKGASEYSTFEKVRNALYVPPETHNVAVDPALDKIMRKALAKDRDQRYKRGAELNADLQRFVLSGGEPITNETLADTMSELFGAERDGEMKKLSEYRSLRPPAELVVSDEKAREEAEAALDDSTRVMSLPTAVEDPNTDRVEIYEAEAVTEPRFGDADIVDEKTKSESWSADALLKDTIDELRKSHGAKNVAVVGNTAVRAAMPIDATAVMPPSKPTPPKPPPVSLSSSQELDHELSAVLGVDPPATRIVALNHEQVATDPALSLRALDRVRTTGEPSWHDGTRTNAPPVHPGSSPRPSEAPIVAGGDDDDSAGFSRGEILLIVGAGMFAVLFVVAVYLFTNRPA